MDPTLIVVGGIILLVAGMTAVGAMQDAIDQVLRDGIRTLPSSSHDDRSVVLGIIAGLQVGVALGHPQALGVAVGIAAGATLGTYLGRPVKDQLRRIRKLPIPRPRRSLKNQQTGE